MDDITEFFKQLLEQNRNAEIAEIEFRRMMDDDSELQAEYKKWCRDNEYTTKNGFRQFCREYAETKASIWETLNDYDE